MKTVAARNSVERYRRRMRRSGFRLTQLWVPDTRAPGFAQECRRQSRLAAEHPNEIKVLSEIEKLHDTEGWS